MHDELSRGVPLIQKGWVPPLRDPHGRTPGHRTPGDQARTEGAALRGRGGGPGGFQGLMEARAHAAPATPLFFPMTLWWSRCGILYLMFRCAASDRSLPRCSASPVRLARHPLHPANLTRPATLGGGPGPRRAGHWVGHGCGVWGGGEQGTIQGPRPQEAGGAEWGAPGVGCGVGAQAPGGGAPGGGWGAWRPPAAFMSLCRRHLSGEACDTLMFLGKGVWPRGSRDSGLPGASLWDCWSEGRSFQACRRWARCPGSGEGERAQSGRQLSEGQLCRSGHGKALSRRAQACGESGSLHWGGGLAGGPQTRGCKPGPGSRAPLTPLLGPGGRGWCRGPWVPGGEWTGALGSAVMRLQVACGSSQGACPVSPTSAGKARFYTTAVYSLRDALGSTRLVLALGPSSSSSSRGLKRNQLAMKSSGKNGLH